MGSKAIVFIGTLVKFKGRPETNQRGSQGWDRADVFSAGPNRKEFGLCGHTCHHCKCSALSS